MTDFKKKGAKKPAVKKAASKATKQAKEVKEAEEAPQMFEAVATVNTQVRVGDRIVTVSRGTVMSFTELPNNFIPIGDYTVDFARDSYDVLMATEWDALDAVKFVKDTYGKAIDVNGKAKSEIVKSIIDARERGTL